MEYTIGEIFEYDGEWYQCCNTEIYCPGCAFFKTKCNSQVLGKCDAIKRTDGKNVVFKKLEKVGEPYIIGNKLIQRYKIYPTTYQINVYGWYYHNLDVKSWTIDIEIKQTKEDMSNTETLWYGPDKKEAKSLKLSNLKPFSLEAAKAGKPVCTRDGRKARIICFDAKRKDERNIVAVIPSKDYPGFEDVIAYPNDGNYYGGHENDGDLMMLLEKKEGWVNVYRNEKGEYWSEQIIFSTKKDATDFVHDYTQYVTTVKITWEE